jgi:hypothetical protein
MVHLMEELLQGYEFAAFDGGTTFADGCGLGFGRGVNAVAALKIINTAARLRARARNACGVPPFGLFPSA